MPNPNEPAPYGIGSSHWPGVGKSTEEMGELLLVLGKLQGSGGEVEHWSGNLAKMMADEIADVTAVLAFLQDHNSQIGAFEVYISARIAWKRDLFEAWHNNLPESEWPQPEAYGLPPREKSND